MDIYKNTPYTYFIMWTSTRMKYYGCQYGKNANPNNILTHRYKTSSKHVKEYWSQFGPPDIIVIHRTFNSVVECRNFESAYLRRVGAVKKQDWINKTDNRSIAPECSGGASAVVESHKSRKEHLESDPKFREQFVRRAIENFNSDRAKEKRKQTFQKNKHSQGEKNPRYGVNVKGTEIALKISETRKLQVELNRKAGEMLNAKTKVCEHCGMGNLSSGNYKRWHHTNCKSLIKNLEEDPHSTHGDLL